MFSGAFWDRGDIGGKGFEKLGVKRHFMVCHGLPHLEIVSRDFQKGEDKALTIPK